MTAGQGIRGANEPCPLTPRTHPDPDGANLQEEAPRPTPSDRSRHPIRAWAGEKGFRILVRSPFLILGSLMRDAPHPMTPASNKRPECRLVGHLEAIWSDKIKAAVVHALHPASPALDCGPTGPTRRDATADRARTRRLTGRAPLTAVTSFPESSSEDRVGCGRRCMPIIGDPTSLRVPGSLSQTHCWSLSGGRSDRNLRLRGTLAYKPPRTDIRRNIEATHISFVRPFCGVI